MSTSNENKDKTFIRGKKSKGFLEINQELCELNKVYDDFKITSIRKNRFETCIGHKIQLYKLIVEKDGIESTLELGWEDSFSLASYTSFYYLQHPEDINLPKVVSFAWIKAEGPPWKETPYAIYNQKGIQVKKKIQVDLKILWNRKKRPWPFSGWES